MQIRVMPKQRSSSKNEKEMKETYRSFSSKNEMELNLSVDFKCTNVIFCTFGAHCPKLNYTLFELNVNVAYWYMQNTVFGEIADINLKMQIIN